MKKVLTFIVVENCPQNHQMSVTVAICPMQALSQIDFHCRSLIHIDALHVENVLDYFCQARIGFTGIVYES